MTGKFQIDSRRFNQPSFSFGLKHDYYSKKPPLLSKQHKVDYYARDSPGAGTYSPEKVHDKFNETTVSWSMSKDKRFKGPCSELANHQR